MPNISPSAGEISCGAGRSDKVIGVDNFDRATTLDSLSLDSATCPDETAVLRTRKKTHEHIRNINRFRFCRTFLSSPLHEV
jgi:hypothetical protein